MAGKTTQQRRMEEAPESSKESSRPAHANGMNERMNTCVTGHNALTSSAPLLSVSVVLVSLTVAHTVPFISALMIILLLPTTCLGR